MIVGVSTDELVQSYKHKKPVVPYEERIEIVRAIRYVDKVLPQITMDKLDAWHELHFDAIFHGDDWKGSKLYDECERQLSQYHVDVVFLPHTTGTSSTMLTDKLQNLE